ncbi:MAG: portal protein [Puniceicoccaceae bacterium]|nr:MAG: portal protein [Puniceicoccaceae bacterium]
MDTLDFNLVNNLGLIVITAAVFALLGRIIRMPSIILYIAAGLVLGPLTGLMQVDDALDLIAHVGIALLLFLVGLELSLDKIRDVGKVAVAAGIGQVVFTASGGFVLCLLLDFTVMESVFLSVALTFSSTVVVVKLLDQKGDLNKLYGRIAVGIFLVQDLVVILVLTILAGLGQGDEVNFANIGIGLAKAFGGMALLLTIALVASKYALPRPFAWAARSPDTIFVWALFWCFLVVGLAGVFELSLEIGAFLAGIALAQLPYNDDLRRRFHPLMNFFIAVFFVTLGIQMDLSAAHENWISAVVLSLFVIIGNPVIFIVIISRMSYSELTSFRTSVTVAQISEFSFIFATAGVASGLIGNDILSIVAVVGIVTITTSAYMILYSDPLYHFCRRFGLLKVFRAKQEVESDEDHGEAGHIIIVGMNPLGRALASALHEKGEHVLAVDTDPKKLAYLPCKTEIGNVEYESVLQDIALEHAKLVISALQIEDANLLLAHRCKQLDIPCVIHAFDTSVVDDLLHLKVQYLLMPQVEGAVQQREYLKKEGILPQ